jgi:probable O-glycosylation ligase (exosortase A-associated)
MLRLIFVCIIGSVGLVAAIRSRFGALLFYIWFAVFRPQEWMWIDITALRPSLAIGMLLVLPSLMTGVFPHVAHPLSIGAIFFWLCALAAQAHAVRPDLGWYWLDLVGKMILVGLFLVRLTDTRRRFTAVMTVIAGSFAFWSAKAGLASLTGGGVRFAEGYGGAFSDNNAYATGCVMVLPLLIAVAQNASSRTVRWVAAVSVPLSAFTVISTFSRGGFVALLAATGFFLMLQRRRFLMTGALVTLLAVALPFVPLPSGYTDRLQTIQAPDEIEEESALSRFHVWAVAWEVTKDQPLGVGLWNFQWIYDKYDFSFGRWGGYRAVHNSHLQAITEAGWAGGAAWTFLFAWSAFLTLRIRWRARMMTENGSFYVTMANGLLTSHVAFFVGGTFVSMAYNDLTWLTFALMAALDRLSRVEQMVPVVEPVIPSGLPVLPLPPTQPVHVKRALLQP